MQGLTVVYYNVDSAQNDNDISEKRRKRQVDSNNQPTHLYIAFETKGEEPVNVNFTATQRDDIFVPPTTTSTPEPEPSTITPTPELEPSTITPTPELEPPTTSLNPELEPPTTATPRIIDTVSLFCLSSRLNSHKYNSGEAIHIPSLFGLFTVCSVLQYLLLHFIDSGWIPGLVKSKTKNMVRTHSFISN